MNIGIVGAAGRMGRMLIRAVGGADGATLIGGTEHGAHEDLGVDLGTLAGLSAMDVALTSDADALFNAADVVIDFTIPAATVNHVALAVKTNTMMVIGTTGLEPHQQQAIDNAAQKTAIIQAANYSVGVNALQGLVKQAAAIFPELYDIEIVEMHHRHKVDAPSGTALLLGQAAAEGRGVDLNAVSDRGRDGITGERKSGDIGFASLRGGDVAGEHTVMFAGAGERVELTHIATDRDIFASGAVRAAIWAGAQKPGKYSMKDVLGLSD